MIDFQNLDLLIAEEIQNACLLIFRPIENQLAETYMHPEACAITITYVSLSNVLAWERRVTTLIESFDG